MVGIAFLVACNRTFEVGVEATGNPTPHYTQLNTLPQVGTAILEPQLMLGEVSLYRSSISWDETIATLQRELTDTGWVLARQIPLTSGTTLRFTHADYGPIVVTVVTESQTEDILVAISNSGSEGEFPAMAVFPINISSKPNILLMPDAFDVLYTENTTDYKTNSDFNAVVEFYQTELSARDWQVNSETINSEEQRADLFYIRQDTVLKITISPNPDTDALIVSIAIQ